MKRVFSSSEDVIHLFAQQTQSDARASSNNVFFKQEWNCERGYGTKIYSYGHHYLLGEFIDDDTIMINDEGYSVTTSRHISQISWATSQYKQFFTTETNLNLVYRKIIDLKDKLSRARKPEMYINPLLNLWEKLNEYAEFKRKKNKIYKKDFMTYHDDRYKEIRSIVKALNNSSEDYKKKLEIAAKKEARAKKLRDAKELKIKLDKFNKYKIDSFRVGDKDFLRVSQDGTKVETSQRVSVSVDNAKLLYKLILGGVDIKGQRIEHYTVTSINGTLKIGCHNINMDSVHKVGKIIMSM
jgi:hypothetical protein